MWKIWLQLRHRLPFALPTGWALPERHKHEVWRVAKEVEKAFTEHPEATGETYLQHLWFTFTMAVRFAYTSTAIMLHGLFPFLCTRTASNQIERVYAIMKSRIPLHRREAIDRAGKFAFTERFTANHHPHIAIVGGGFSGAMVLANLVAQAQTALTIYWYEASEIRASGVAYSTSESVHLLNVRADRMGAFAGKPEDFFRWLQSSEGKAHSAAYPSHTTWTGESFVPRALYGKYLQHVVAEALRGAATKSIEVQCVQAELVDATHTSNGGLMLGVLKDGEAQQQAVDALVLATGNLPPKAFGFEAGLIEHAHAYVPDVWHTPAGHLYPQQVHTLPEDATIAIIGTGLTMVDTVLTLQARGYKGNITAISRHGLLPAAHATCNAYPAWEWVNAPENAPRTALGLLVRLRKEIQFAAAHHYDWRSVIDSLRPITTPLWAQLEMPEKRRFLRKLLTFWNVHRHRMAPEIAAEIQALRECKRVQIIAASIYYMGSDAEGLTLAYRRRGSSTLETLRPTLVLNCTGPTSDVAASDHRLLKNLRDRQLITIGPLRAGIETTRYGTASGLSSAIYPVGSLLVGERLESAAVPELREQAASIATQMLESFTHARLAGPPPADYSV
jgi:uncharacterized NAD(P)/FAD-binding protein YdhS